MELDKVRELIDMMKANDLNELEIVDGQIRIVLKRGSAQPVAQVVAQPVALTATESLPVGPPRPAPAPEATAAAAEDKPKLVEIISPIVGTFYAAPSPNAEPFVEVDSPVEENNVVCIIEAMKVMNEIKSGVAGTVRKVLVANGSAVEYGQALFLVEPK
ncbi:MAG: acetyl-CoA carboxylase biotin carboxyl carrier protein [Sedimentisphaerales bacterium]|nr:acetyl-CoA carboxylase biotin carboxyl carrier protein [Sedimentisphaerales bacterium]